MTDTRTVEHRMSDSELRRAIGTLQQRADDARKRHDDARKRHDDEDASRIEHTIAEYREEMSRRR